MKRSFAALAVTAAVIFALFASGAQAAELPPNDRCTATTLKTVKKGNRLFKADSWFTRRLNRARCIGRAKPKRFKAFSSRCKAKTDRARNYLSLLQQRFIPRLDALLLNNQPRLIRLDAREISLLNQRRKVNRQFRDAGPDRRASLNRRSRKIEQQLITVRTKRARINYSINTRAITRRGAAGIWLTYFDGVAHGCLKAFRGSPYLTVMREHFLVQLAAAQYVSPRPNRSKTATWSNLLSARTLSPDGKR
ncbi:MAG: hypothetical protein M3Y23_02935 [Actinomycetota bacterium]|nr:hypothetical protein [Actinomycetota bacterium]